MKSYTDLEQSKKLTEIISIESADMHYARVKDEEYDWIPLLSPIPKLCAEYIENIPCWSLAALMNLLPSEFTEVGKYSTTTYEIKIRKYKFTDEVNLHQIAYGSYKWYEDGSCSWSDMINTGEKEDLLDAVFQMICWLKENNKL